MESRLRSTARLRQELLSWYDSHGRVLPWRIRPEDRETGRKADPYAVWLSEIMLQQTTVPHATTYFSDFLSRWPTVHDLAAADRDDVMSAWSGLGYYARARNLHACAREVAAGGGEFPVAEKDLLALPGIGPYTSAAIRSLAFDLPANVVDGNVERVMARMHAVELPLPGSKKKLRELAARMSDPDRPGDYAQALMDLGAVICRPAQPDCGACPWATACLARASGEPASYPRKSAVKRRPVRRGAAYLVTCGERIWLRRRPDEGLLGGMLEVPSSAWLADGESVDADVPVPGHWESLGEVRHVFTHFTLILEVLGLVVSAPWKPPVGDLYPLHDVADLALPTLMRKVIEAGRPKTDPAV